jgi:hypothetical protein
MNKSIISENKPLIGFFPGFEGIGETYPLIKIAKHYQDIGGKVVIFSRGGEYEYLAREQGFRLTRIKPIATGGEISRYFMENSDEDVIKMIKDEALAYQNAGIKALVQTNVYFFSKLAPRLAKIPLISIISGTLTPAYYQSNYADFPDRFENLLTKYIPLYFKNKYYKWRTLNYKGPVTKKFNQIAEKINIKIHFNSFQELILGDHTLICDDIAFLGLKPTNNLPAKNYIGPILSDELFKITTKKEENEINNHLKKPGKSILLTMGGSSRMKDIYLEVLKILNKTDYNVITSYTSILNKEELPKLNKNILLKKFISLTPELNKRVDLAIIHGGRGTVYNAAYSGKPAIGIPLNSEQQYNIDCLIRHGMALRVSKTFFKKEKMLSAIKEIFNNYDKYFKNAQALSKKLPKSDGDKNAAYRILEITNNVV